MRAASCFTTKCAATYDTPDVAESRRIVEEAMGELSLDDPDDDEPWRGDLQA